MRIRIALALLALTFVACSTGDDDAGNGGGGSAATTTTTSLGTSTSAASAATSTTAFAGGVTEVSTPPTEYRYLKAVRVGAHSGYDRIVFEFESGVPGYSVKYVNRPVVQDGSGATINVAGDAVLQVRFESASGADLTSGFRQTYSGSNRIKATGPSIREAVIAGDFEAVLTWVVGVAKQRLFSVYTVEGNKLVVDVAA